MCITVNNLIIYLPKPRNINTKKYGGHGRRTHVLPRIGFMLNLSNWLKHPGDHRSLIFPSLIKSSKKKRYNISLGLGIW